MVSKLNSSLLLITPACVDPAAFARGAINMYETDLAGNDIDFNFAICQFYTDHQIKWALLDPSILTQILVNLLTNAIKFTKLAKRRQILVRIGASSSVRHTSPQHGTDGVVIVAQDSVSSREVSAEESHGNLNNAETIKWFPSHEEKPSSEQILEEDEFYLNFEVQDTGTGISAYDMAVIFERFSQANPKTDVQYGGSGLGLFISRESFELHGGVIGLVSTLGEGSTFAFYLKVRQASPQDTETLQVEKSASGVQRSPRRKNLSARSQPPTPA
jgi:signal transduction histidine kinase